MAASRTRAATKPSATPSFCRLRTGYSVTAVPDAGEGHDHLKEAALEHARVAAGAEDPVPVVLHGAVEGESVGIEMKVIR
jgi:hypothetical protein